MKILITGGAGFIGYHLMKKLLSNGNTIVVADDFSRGVEDCFLKELECDNRIELVKINLLNKDEVKLLGEEYDYIYHLAAMIGVQIVLDHPYDVLRKNVEMLCNIIDLANNQKHLKRFMFASTSEIYAGTLKYYGLEVPTPEETPLTITPLDSPRTSYMLSKIYGEALIRQSKLPFTIFRPHNFYGPRMGMSHVIPELMQKVNSGGQNGKEIEVFSINHKRTFCYIEDAVEMIVRLALTESAEGGAFNIGNEHPEVKICEVAETILKVMGKEMEIVPMPPTEGSPERRCPSMAKTFAIIKYQPKVTLEEGIKKTYEWYRENIFNGKEICAK